MSVRGLRIRALLLTVFAACAFAACSGAQPIGVPLPHKPRFDRQWQRYLGFTPSKALAVAGDLDGLYVTGYAFAHESEPSAIEAALTHCEQRRRDRRLASPCRMLAVGDTRLAADRRGG